jgi:hypothetical protein
MDINPAANPIAGPKRRLGGRDARANPAFPENDPLAMTSRLSLAKLIPFFLSGESEIAGLLFSNKGFNQGAS